jgi:hypothetical protein
LIVCRITDRSTAITDTKHWTVPPSSTAHV